MAETPKWKVSFGNGVGNNGKGKSEPDQPGTGQRRRCRRGDGGAMHGTRIFRAQKDEYDDVY